MKIQSIQNKNYAPSKNSKSSTQRNFSIPSFGVGGCYGGGGNAFGPGTSQKVYTWAAKKLRILTRTDSEMKDLAEYFHKKSNQEIKGVTSEAHNWSSKKAEETANRLISYVSPIRNEKSRKLNRISELEIKKGTGISNLVGQKARLNGEFISLIAAEKEGMKPSIKNGILIHGSSKSKDDFINWLTESSGAVVKTVQHDSANPMKTISDIIELAENAETAFNHSKTRTLIVVKDLDEMLKRPTNRDEVKLINGFKAFAEDLSEKYHTTLISKTDKNLEDFEPATIASNRLGVHVDLKDGITEDELKELGNLNAEIKRLDDKAEAASSKFKS